MHRSDADVGQVDGNLCNAVFFDVPANGLAGFQRARDPNLISLFIFFNFSGDGIAFADRAAFFTDIICNRIGTPGGSRIQVNIISNQEISCADGDGAGAGLNFAGPKSGFQCGSSSFFGSPSYSPARQLARFLLSSVKAAFS